MKQLKLPAFTKNFYFLVTLLFGLWMLFFDANDFITQYNRGEKLKKLKANERYYTKGIRKIERERKELATSKEKLERFAREKYYLKKPKEDVYVIVESNDDEEEKTSPTPSK